MGRLDKGIQDCRGRCSALLCVRYIAVLNAGCIGSYSHTRMQKEVLLDEGTRVRVPRPRSERTRIWIRSESAKYNAAKHHVFEVHPC